MLIQNVSERGGPGKIFAYREKKVRVVKQRRGINIPVYVVTPLDGEGRERTLHSNLLLTCPYLVNGQIIHLKERTKDNKREKNLEKSQAKT